MNDEYYKIIEEKIIEKVNKIVEKDDITFEEYEILKSEHSRKEIDDLRERLSGNSICLKTEKENTEK